MKVGAFFVGLALAQDEATTTITTTIETTTTTTTTEATTTVQQEIVEKNEKASEENIYIEIGDAVDLSDDNAVLDNVMTQAWGSYYRDFVWYETPINRPTLTK